MSVGYARGDQPSDSGNEDFKHFFVDFVNFVVDSPLCCE